MTLQQSCINAWRSFPLKSATLNSHSSRFWRAYALDKTFLVLACSCVSTTSAEMRRRACHLGVKSVFDAGRAVAVAGFDGVGGGKCIGSYSLNGVLLVGLEKVPRADAFVCFVDEGEIGYTGEEVEIWEFSETFGSCVYVMMAMRMKYVTKQRE